MSTIYADNFPADAEEDSLRNLFADYGDVVSLTLVREGQSLRGRSYCLVEMRELAKAARAVSRLNGQYFRGQLLQVEHYPSSRPS
jgi:RNA recognition motif-containing protein